MDEFNVLNTVVGGTDPGAVVFGVFFGVCALLLFGLFIFAVIENEAVSALVLFLLALLIAGFSVIVFTEKTPTTYEITLKEGATIDATKYDIVEQRGQIYVIKERKNP